MVSPCGTHAPADQRGHAQILAHLLHVDVFAFVAKDRMPRLHLQIGHVRQIVDQRFGDAVAEIVGLGIAAVVGERQHGQRIDLRRLVRSHIPRDAARSQRKSHDHADGHDDRHLAPPARSDRRHSAAGRRRMRRQTRRFGIALQPLQIGAQIGRALVAQIAIFLQRLADDALQLRRDSGFSCDGRRRLVAQNRAADFA